MTTDETYWGPDPQFTHCVVCGEMLGQYEGRESGHCDTCKEQYFQKRLRDK